MKYQILAGTLGLVIFLGLVQLPAAEGAAFLIDDFSDDNNLETCDFQIVDNTNAPDRSVQTGLTGVQGGIRECVNFLTAFDGQSNSGILVVQATGMFRQMGGTNIGSSTMLIYDAQSNDAGANSLNLNTVSSDNFKIGYSKADNAVDVTVEYTDGDGDVSTQMGQLSAGTNAPTELLFVNANFAVNNVDLNDIQRIKVTLQTTSDVSDWDIDSLEITMEMVGGEMFPVDTTALLLAGAELNAIWMLPAIAAIGIGAFVVFRKRN